MNFVTRNKTLYLYLRDFYFNKPELELQPKLLFIFGFIC